MGRNWLPLSLMRLRHNHVLPTNSRRLQVFGRNRRSILASEVLKVISILPYDISSVLLTDSDYDLSAGAKRFLV